MSEPTSFQCPTCETPYKVARVATPVANDRELLCLSCGGPLRNREGKFALKYFKADGSAPKKQNGRRPKLI
jgi:hypothetical protein